MAESAYQKGLTKRIKALFPGCELIKNDAGYRQGFPDWTLLYGPCWATLEVKDNANSAERPNQAHYVEKHRNMSFSAFIYPENEEEVLTALQEAFASRGAACIP